MFRMAQPSIVNLSAASSASSLLLSSLELSDTKVYEPEIRALLRTAAHFCKVGVLKLSAASRSSKSASTVGFLLETKNEV